ncbi:uncharacterized protein LOC144865110 [Branchiostoma floridae x Branchiostoma japonicum]
MYPSNVTVSDEGEIFVADRGNHRIQVFTLQGEFVRLSPTVVSGKGMMDPHDVAMDGEGNLWVVGYTKFDEFAIQYTKQGRMLRKFNLLKTWENRGVAVDTRRNHILITQITGDWNKPNGEVLVFRPDGTFVRTVGQQQDMKVPWNISVDEEGNILVSDWIKHCIFVYNEDGQFLFQFGGEGKVEGQLKHPHGICTDQAGNIIVADWGNRRVEMFDKTGRFLKHITKNIRWPHGVAMATHGQLVVADVTNQTVSIFHNSCCEVLQQQTTLSGEFLPSAPIPAASAPIPAAPAPIPATPVPICAEAMGTGHHHGIQGQEEPKFQRVTFGGKGSGKGQFRCPRGVAVSDEGEIFVADGGNQRIQVFTLQGTFVRQFPTIVPGEEDTKPHDVAIDGEGNLWVVVVRDIEDSDKFAVSGEEKLKPDDVVMDRVVRDLWGVETDFVGFAVQYNKHGRMLKKFDLQKTGWDRGVAVDTRRNHILITQSKPENWTLHGEVLVFSPDGVLVRTVGQQKGMMHPGYITVDGKGKILASDVYNRVHVYNEDGEFLFQFGSRGCGEGQLYSPRGICTDRAGNIIVADRGNNRVEMFDKTGKFLKHITTDMERPWAVAMGPQGQLVVTDYEKHTVTIFPSY